MSICDKAFFHKWVSTKAPECLAQYGIYNNEIEVCIYCGELAKSGDGFDLGRMPLDKYIKLIERQREEYLKAQEIVQGKFK